MCSRLDAAPQLCHLTALESLALHRCSLVGGGWRAVWPGLTALTELRFDSCLGSSLSQQVRPSAVSYLFSSSLKIAKQACPLKGLCTWIGKSDVMLGVMSKR
jgi:hypothetical protein